MEIRTEHRPLQNDFIGDPRAATIIVRREESGIEDLRSCNPASLTDRY